MKKILYFILLFGLNLSAQDIWQAKIPVTDSSGYYNIKLSQEIIGLSKNNFADIKIRDEKNNEVPYFLRSSNPVKEISHFEDYILKKNETKDSLNTIVIENSKHEEISRFYITTNNADVTKYAGIRGSNDAEKWYVVKKQIPVYSQSSEIGQKENIIILDFPKGDYKYYEIALSNDQKSPLEILKVSKINNSNIYGQFSIIPLGTFKQVERPSDKKTRIFFPPRANEYLLNKLEITISNKFQYLRQAYIIDTVSMKRVSFELSSKKTNTFLLDGFKLTKNVILEIENNNNQPLTIESINAYGLERYLCAYLEPGKNYLLFLEPGNPVYTQYDIENFKKDIPTNLPLLSISELEQISKTKTRELSFIEQPIFLWSIIILVGGFLVFICIKMIQEVKKKENK